MIISSFILRKKMALKSPWASRPKLGAISRKCSSSREVRRERSVLYLEVITVGGELMNPTAPSTMSAVPTPSPKPRAPFKLGASCFLIPNEPIQCHQSHYYRSPNLFNKPNEIFVNLKPHCKQNLGLVTGNDDLLKEIGRAHPIFFYDS